MGFISQLRNPTAWYAKLVIAILALAIFGFLALAAISGYAVYRIVLPERSESVIDLQNLPGHPLNLQYTVPGEGTRDSWFFPGLKTAPSVILCPGYQSSRGELLTLASALQDHQYNVLWIDFSGQGSSPGRSTLGFQEVKELRAAMNAVADRGDVDTQHFGLWGENLGAYVALSEAVEDPRVRAIAAESPYGHPDDMVGILVARMGLGPIPLVLRMAKFEFEWLNADYRDVPSLKQRLPKLSGVAQLYLESPGEPLLQKGAQELFQFSPAPHELVDLEHGNYAGMLDDEKRSYENRIVSFFLVHLPPSPSQ
ncbi:MAG: alpha/beta hydrolase [Candidatus Acidiferrales bacterium]